MRPRIAVLLWAASVLLGGCAEDRAAEETYAEGGYGTSRSASATGTTYLVASNVGANTSTQATIWAGKANRALVRWDLSAIPTTATVTSAELKWTSSGSRFPSLNVHQLKRRAVYSQATWNLFAAGSPWESPGAFGALDVGGVNATFTPTAGTFSLTYQSGAMVSMVQSWVSTPTSNHGLLLGNPAATSEWSFPGAGQVGSPKLVVTYTTPGCDPSALRPVNSDPGMTVLADHFESGDFREWTTVTAEGDATAQVQSATAYSGACAARLHVTSSDLSRANLAKALPAGTREVWADGRFNIQRQGSDTASNVPTFRFYSGGQRLLDVSRQNGSGALFIRWPNGAGGWTITPLGRSLEQNRWYRIKLRGVAAFSQSITEVWLDGEKLFSTSAATLPVQTIDTVRVGAEHRKQDGDFVADEIVLKALASPSS